MRFLYDETLKQTLTITLQFVYVFIKYFLIIKRTCTRLVYIAHKLRLSIKINVDKIIERCQIE